MFNVETSVRKKNSRNSCLIPGQLSMFDIIKSTKTVSSVKETKNTVNSVKLIDREKDELLDVNSILKDSEKSKQKDVALKSVKVGDYIRARYGTKVIEGKITREYGMNNEILNIEFMRNNAIAVTAIGRSFIIKILKSA